MPYAPTRLNCKYFDVTSGRYTTVNDVTRQDLGEWRHATGEHVIDADTREVLAHRRGGVFTQLLYRPHADGGMRNTASYRTMERYKHVRVEIAGATR